MWGLPIIHEIAWHERARESMGERAHATVAQHARLEIPIDLRDPIAFSPPRPASETADLIRINPNPTRERGMVCPSLTLRVVIEPLPAANPLNQQSRDQGEGSKIKRCGSFRYYSTLATSPPAAVPIAFQAIKSMLSEIKPTDPSQRVVLTPPV